MLLQCAVADFFCFENDLFWFPSEPGEDLRVEGLFLEGVQVRAVTEEISRILSSKVLLKVDPLTLRVLTLHKGVVGFKAMAYSVFDGWRKDWSITSVCEDHGDTENVSIIVVRRCGASF